MVDLGSAWSISARHGRSRPGMVDLGSAWSIAARGMVDRDSGQSRSRLIPARAWSTVIRDKADLDAGACACTERLLWPARSQIA